MATLAAVAEETEYNQRADRCHIPLLGSRVCLRTVYKSTRPCYDPSV